MPRLRPILLAFLAALLTFAAAATPGAAQQGGQTKGSGEQTAPEQEGTTPEGTAAEDTLSVENTAQKVTLTAGCVVVTTPDQDIAIGEACEGGETMTAPTEGTDGSTKSTPKTAPTPDAAPEGSAKDTLNQIIEQCSTEAAEDKKPESADQDATPESTTTGTAADEPADEGAERQGEENDPQGDRISAEDGLSDEECQKFRAALSPDEDQQATDNDELSGQPVSGSDGAGSQNDTPEDAKGNDTKGDDAKGDDAKGDDAEGDDATDGDEKDDSVGSGTGDSGTGDSANETPGSGSTQDAPDASGEPEESQDDQKGPAGGIEVQIARVIDGDTVELAKEVEGKKTVRLIGVDTPEMTSGGSDAAAPSDESAEDTGDPREDESSDEASSDEETPEAEAPKAEAPENDPNADDTGTFGEDAPEEDATSDEPDVEEPSGGKSSSFGMVTPSIFFTRLAYAEEPAATEAGAEPYAEEASAFTTEQLEGQTVTLEPDEDHEDDHGRLLAYVWLDEELFNELLLEKGYGELLIIEPNTLHEERLKAAEAKAKEENLGIWGLNDASEDGTDSGAAKPDAADPKATEPKATSPEGPKPEAAKPEAAKPEKAQTEAAKPEGEIFGGQKPKAPGVKPPAAQSHDTLPAEKKEELNKKAENNRPTAFVGTQGSDGSQQLNLPETGGPGAVALPETGGVSIQTAWPLLLASGIAALAIGLVLFRLGHGRLNGQDEA